MRWEDLLFSAASLLALGALLPSVLGKFKPPFSTSALTTFCLLCYTIGDAGLGLPFSTAVSILTMVAWATLAWQARP